MPTLPENGFKQLSLFKVVSSNQAVFKQALDVQQGVHAHVNMQAALLPSDLPPGRLPRVPKDEQPILCVWQIPTRSIVHKHDLEVRGSKLNRSLFIWPFESKRD
jgi:hypothetical protein